MIGKTPKWAESRFTPNNLLHAVECCMADGSRCYDCPLEPWDECQNILLTHLAEKLGIEKNKNNLKKGLDKPGFPCYNLDKKRGKEIKTMFTLNYDNHTTTFTDAASAINTAWAMTIERFAKVATVTDPNGKVIYTAKA